MKLSPKQIAELPTLEDVILNFADLTEDFEDDGGWLSQATFINDMYIKSIQCMYEMSSLVSNGHIADRLFPIVDIEGKRDAEACAAYISYWTEELNKRRELLSSLTPGTMQQVLDEMGYCNAIITEFNKFWKYITDFNTLSKEDLMKDDCKKLVESLRTKLSSL